MIHRGDLFDVLPTLAECSVDACVTDPPYGIGFMGKKWDTFKPDVTSAMRARTVKNHKAAKNPNLKGRLQWAGGAAVEYDYTAEGMRGFQSWTEQWAREVYRVLKPGAHLLVCGAPRSFHRMACGVEDAGFEMRDCLSWLYGQGFPKSLNVGEGRGTALKPSWEPIILARKPLTGTVAANLQKHGTGALNIDACRIEAEAGWQEWVLKTARPNSQGQESSGVVYGKGMKPTTNPSDLGRWPANVCLDEEAAAMLDEQSGECQSSPFMAATGGAAHERTFSGGIDRYVHGGYNDSGGASRFYYVAKPSRAERDYGCDSLPARSGGEATDRTDGSAGVNSPRAGAGRTGGARNIHPTVKPVELMRWLVRLVTPSDGVVLDPFAGSGTTGMACRYELRKFIGIEREAEYVEIARRRMAAAVPLFGGRA